MHFTTVSNNDGPIVEWALEVDSGGDVCIRANGIAVGYFCCVNGSFNTYTLSPGRYDTLKNAGFKLKQARISVESQE